MTISLNSSTSNRLGYRVKLPFVCQAFIYAVVSVASIYSIYFNYLARCAHVIDFSSFLISASFPLLILLLAVVVFAVSNVHNEPSRIFLLISIPAVTALSMFILPGHVPDEAAHIAQVAGLFSRSPDGFYIPLALSGESLPQTYEQFYIQLISEPNWHNLIFTRQYLSTYLPHLYIIPALALKLGELFSLNELLALIVARLAHGLFFSLVGYYFTKLIPFGRTAFVVFLLNPMLLQQAASCSADAISNIAIIGFIVILLRANAMSAINPQDIVLVLVTAFIMVISKFLYAPFLLLLLLFVKRLKSSLARLGTYLITILLLIIVSIYMVFYYRGSFMHMSFELLRDPLEFIAVYVKSIWELAPFWIQSYAGGTLGALSIGVWQPCYWSYIVIQICVLFYNDDHDSEAIKLSCSDRLIMCITALINFSCILLSMREWSVTVDGRADIIMGVQGRYLFPIVLMPLLSMLRFNTEKPAPHHVLYTVSAILAAILCLDMYSIIQFFN